MDIKSAFSYFQKDKNWLNKYIIGVLLLFPSTICSLLSPFNDYVQSIPFVKDLNSQIQMVAFIFFAILYIVCTVLIIGYNFLNLNTRIYKKDVPLPDWSDIKPILKTGLKTIWTIILAMILITIFYLILTTITVVIISIFSQSDLTVLLSVSTLICFILSLFVFIPVFTAATIAFGTNLKISSFFNVNLIFNIVKENKLKFFINILICIILFAALSILSILITKSKFYYLAFFIPFFSFMFNLIMVELLPSIPRPDEQQELKQE